MCEGRCLLPRPAHRRDPNETSMRQNEPTVAILRFYEVWCEAKWLTGKMKRRGSVWWETFVNMYICCGNVEMWKCGWNVWRWVSCGMTLSLFLIYFSYISLFKFCPRSFSTFISFTFLALYYSTLWLLTPVPLLFFLSWLALGLSFFLSFSFADFLIFSSASHSKVGDGERCDDGELPRPF